MNNKTSSGRDIDRKEYVMPKKITLTDMQEHLFEMAERLLDDEVCSDTEKLQAEINKANALVGIAGQVIQIKDVENKTKEVNIKAMQVAHNCGLLYEPEGMNLKQLPSNEKSNIKIGPYGKYED